MILTCDHFLSPLRQSTRGRCWPTCSAAWPGSACPRSAAWTSACPSCGSCSSRPAPSSAGTDRSTAPSGKRHAARSHPRGGKWRTCRCVAYVCACVSFLLQERQLIQVLCFLLRVHLSGGHLRDPVHRHLQLGHQVRRREKCIFKIVFIAVFHDICSK